jgi:DNA-directed RNA polymerase specialized sigma24 family protein
MTAPLRLITPEEVPFERLLGGVLRRSHCFALQLAGDRDAAELLLRDAAAAALDALRREAAPADFGLWFLRIVAERYQARYADPRSVTGSTSDDDDVTAAFQELSPDDRVVNALYFAADLRYAEIAWVLSLPVSVVRERLHRGRRRLLRLVAAGTISAFPPL